MQSTNKAWRVETFGARDARFQPVALRRSERLARGTQSSKPIPLVSFRESQTDFSERATTAFHRQTLLNSLDTKPLQGSQEFHREVLGRSLSVAFQPTVDIEKVNIATQQPDAPSPPAEFEVVSPDIIFSNPHVSLENQISTTGQGIRHRLLAADLWTIILGTLVLSIGAQYLLQGFGVSNL